MADRVGVNDVKRWSCWCGLTYVETVGQLI